MKTFINEPDNTLRLKDTKIVFERNTTFKLPEAGIDLLRKWKSIGFVIKWISGTNRYNVASFGASSDREKLISQYDDIYVKSYHWLLIRKKTEKNVMNLELIINAEIWVELENDSEKRRVIVVTPVKFWTDEETPVEYEVDILTIAIPKSTKTLTDDTKGKTEDLLLA